MFFAEISATLEAPPSVFIDSYDGRERLLCWIYKNDGHFYKNEYSGCILSRDACRPPQWDHMALAAENGTAWVEGGVLHIGCEC